MRGDVNTGYTPLFASLTTGTLCGRWPDVGLWAIVLSLSNRHGLLDVTPMYLSTVTGLPQLDVVACMRRFCETDPYSRTAVAGGARLTLIDEHRDWGWRIVNHGAYREKARKQMQQIESTASGRDADRKRLKRERSASGDIQRSPASSASSSADRPSDSDANTDTDIKHKRNTLRASGKPYGCPEFKRLQLIYPRRAGHQHWPKAFKLIQVLLREGSTWQQILDGAQRYLEFCRATGVQHTGLVQQAATFVGLNRGFEEPWELPLTKAQIIQAQNVSTSRDWLQSQQGKRLTDGSP
jgi:hypothetical protein